MLKEFYGFSEDPFSLNSDSRSFFLTQHHKEILDSIVYGITERREFILLTGETGMGKTTLIHQLLQALGPSIKAIPVYEPPRTFRELLEFILQNLKLPLGERSEKTMWSQFIDYISHGAAQDENFVIIVDVDCRLPAYVSSNPQGFYPDFIEDLEDLRCNRFFEFPLDHNLCTHNKPLSKFFGDIAGRWALR